MDIIYKTVIGIIVAIVIAASGTSIVSAGQDVVNANNYFDDLTSVITESNYSADIIAECIEEAEENGYTLTVTVIGSDDPGMMRYAEATLEYEYKIPLLGVSESKTKTKII